MRSQKLMSASPALLVLLLSALVPVITAADDTTSDTGLPNLSTATEAAATTSSAAASTTESSSSDSASASATSSSIPAITSSSLLPSNLPTLSGYYSYPPPSVPPTADAPFMQKSTLPEGTIFIVVGAILGFLGGCVLAWRGLVVWSIHRSVKRAAMQQNLSDSKAMLGPPGGFYSTGHGSTMSLDALASTGRPGTNAGRGHTASGSLFFSPTAGTGSPMANTNRQSSYLPAGYYASGNSVAGGGAGMTHIGGAPISLSNLGAHAQGYTRARSMGPSPPGSPAMPPSRGNLGSYPSTSTLNLNAPPQGGRTPSAYLEDMFDQQPAHPSNRF